MAYTQSNTDPASVNGMYLKGYMDVVRDISDDLKEGGNVKSFGLHSMLLRSMVIKPELRSAIDQDVIEFNRLIEQGVYGELDTDEVKYYRGFCVVSAAMAFIGNAFHIIQNDSASLADITDDDLMIAFEQLAMHKKIRSALGSNKEKIKIFEQRVASGDITTMAALIQELTLPDEAIPQDDHITQEAAAGTFDDSGL